MAKKFFKQVSRVECDLAKTEGKVGICNISPNKVEIDEDGHFIKPYGHAIVDKTNPMIDRMVGNGILAINATVVEPSSKKSTRQTKKNQDAVDESSVAIEETSIEEIIVSPEPEVAPEDDGV